MGLTFLIIGLVNQDKWIGWNQVTPQKRKLLIAVLLIGFIVLGIILFRYPK